jgi:diguanylate cyclase (GGDEF)-like protein
MLKNTVITKKFPLIMVAFALISALVTGIIAFNTAKTSLTKASEDKIISLLESRKASLANHVEVIRDEVHFHAQSPLISNALRDFSAAWQQLPGNKTQYLQDIYITQNPFSTGDKGSFLSANDGTQYDNIHQQYHPTLRHLVDSRLFYDIFLFDTSGNLVYTADKETDFAQNINSDALKNTGLAKMYKAINHNPDKDRHVFIDYESYMPSHGLAASFIGMAIFDDNHNYIGVFGFEIPIDTVDDVMHVTAGMGKTGETYLVGPDHLMRSNSRFFPENSILKIQVDTLPVKKALNGESGIAVIPDYRDISVSSAYSPINYFGEKWVMLAEVEESEVMGPVYKMSNFLLISGMLLALVIAFIGYVVAHDISHPIITMANAMEELSNDKLDTNISVDRRQDEVGRMAKALIIFKKHALERKSFIKELSHHANHDALTGLPSRKYAMEQMSSLLATAQVNDSKLALMFVDLDMFKPINDTHGHDIGDIVLKRVAELFKLSLRQDDVVARLGGDEFVVILPDITDITDVKSIADKVLVSISNEDYVPDKDISLSASIGISVFPTDAKDGSALLKLADDAMYIAKHSGKNRYHYTEQT